MTSCFRAHGKLGGSAVCGWSVGGRVYVGGGRWEHSMAQLGVTSGAHLGEITQWWWSHTVQVPREVQQGLGSALCVSVSVRAHVHLPSGSILPFNLGD